MKLSEAMTTLAQHATSPIVEHRPQLGDIIIHNYGALVYIGTIERFCTHNPNMVEGPALVVSSADGKFYECQAAHYFDLRISRVVSKPPVMPFEGEAVPEANVPAAPAAAVAGVDALIDIPEPHIGDGVLGSAPDEEPCAALDPDYVKKGPPSAPSNICPHCDGTGFEPFAAYSPESCSVCRGSRVANVSVGVLGSNPDEVPF